MTGPEWTIEGRRFRTAEEYQAALRDKALIDSITENINLNSAKDVENLYTELKNGKYSFESIVGRQFDDNIYELHKKFEAQKEQKAQAERLRKEKLKNVFSRHGKPKKTRAAAERFSLEDCDEDMQREILRVLKRKEQKRKIIIAVCAVLCVAGFGYFTIYYQASAKSAREFEELVALKKAGAAKAAGTSSGEVKIHYTDDSDTPDILAEYEAIYNKNKRLIGWIKIDDTVIDYPVMQTVNNEYYLNHNFNQEEDNNGCIFMDYQCDVIKGCDNIILYGHHMKSGKMFGTLNKYSQKEYYEEHPVIQFDTIYEKGEYQVMFVFRSKVYSEEDVNFKYYQFINAGSEKEFNSYINEMAALSLYDTGVTAAYGDKLLTLSTCDYQESEGRFVVVAKRIE
ncbi:MAG: class B sortase [Lachnospiraceae bacterium]|nr:class B sortase [Lachnospiraceae bacterium]